MIFHAASTPPFRPPRGAAVPAFVLVALAALVSLAALASASRSPAFAAPLPAPETEPDSLRIYPLGEVIVTADRWREDLQVETEVFSAADLAERPGQSARAVLETVPGVQVSSGRKDEAAISIRGFGSRRVAIMVDGRPMNLPYYGTFDLSSVSVDKLEGMLVVRGPVSVTYGPNVMGGVVNFITASGRDRPGTHLSARLGADDSGEIRASHGHVLGAWDLLLSARGGGSAGSVLPHGFRATGYPGTEDGGIRDNSDFTEWDLFGKLGYRPGAKTDLALSWGYQTREKGVPAAVDEERYWRYTDWRRTFADLTLRRELNPTTYLEAKGYGDIFINTLVDYEDDTYDESAAFYNSTHDNWDWGSIVSLEHDWSPAWHGTYGLNVREDQIKKRMNPGDPWLYHHHVTGSLYAEHSGWLRHDLWGSLGLADNVMVYNHMKDVNHIPGFSTGLTARLGEAWSLCGSWGQSSRFPTLSQLWSEGSGNRDLRPEITRRAEVGIRGPRAGRTSLEVTIFRNDLRDLIDRDARRAGRYYNIGSARSWGSEVEVTARLVSWLDAGAGYTYTRSENLDTGERLDLIPLHKVDARLTARSAGGDTRWMLVATRVGARRDGEALTSDRELPGYTVAHCRVTTALGKRTSVSLEVTNLGDASYQEEVMYPAPGRTVAVSGTIDF